MADEGAQIIFLPPPVLKRIMKAMTGLDMQDQGCLTRKEEFSK